MARLSQFMSILAVAMAIVYSCEAQNCTGGPHDKLVKCGSPCPPTCYAPQPLYCGMHCIVDTCECEPRYFRHEGQCVTWDECRKHLEERNNPTETK